MKNQNILREGFIEHKKKHEKYPFIVRYLQIEDIEKMLNLQKIVLNHLDSHEILIKYTKESLAKTLKEGFGLGVFCDDNLIAYRTLTFPSYDSDLNLTNFLDFIPQNEKDFVMHLQTCLVLPEFRGQKLQKLLSEIAIDIATKKNILHICCTISPLNYFSLNNIFHLGLCIRNLRYMQGYYNGLLRYILHKDLRKDPCAFSDFISIQSHDTDKQKKLLDMGYIGFELQGDSDNFKIIYGKLSE